MASSPRGGGGGGGVALDAKMSASPPHNHIGVSASSSLLLSPRVGRPAPPSIAAPTSPRLEKLRLEESGTNAKRRLDSSSSTTQQQQQEDDHKLVKVDVPLFGHLRFPVDEDTTVGALLAQVSEQCGHGETSTYSYDLLLGTSVLDPAVRVLQVVPTGSLLSFVKRAAARRGSMSTRNLSPLSRGSRSSSGGGSKSNSRRSSLVVGSGGGGGDNFVAPRHLKDEVDGVASIVFLLVVLPDKTTALLRCAREGTLAEVKQLAIEAYVKRYPSASSAALRYELKIPKEGLADLSASVSSISYVRRCRSNSMTPSFVLLEADVVARKSKVAEAELASLIGRPLCWTGAEGEVERFRKVMRILRQQERDRPVNTASADFDLGPLENIQFTVTIYLPLLMGGVNKTIQTSSQETGDALRQRVFQKYYKDVAAGKTHKDFILKIVGFNDFVDGQEMMLDHEFLMKQVYMGEKPSLNIVERVPPLPEPNEDDWEDDEDATAIHSIVYDHKLISIEHRPWDQMQVMSVWDMPHPLQVKVLGVDGIFPSPESKLRALLAEDPAGDVLDESSLLLHVTVGVYHGGTLLMECSGSTHPVTAMSAPRWNEWLVFERLRLKNLPRAARLCITLWAALGEARAPVGWVNLQLFDYKHELQCGVVSLPLWTNDEANPIGTCVPNSARGVPVLYLELNSYGLPVVFPTEPLDRIAAASLAPVPVDQTLERTQLQQAVAITKKDSLYQLSPDEKALIWKFRAQLAASKRGLTKLILSVPCDSYTHVQEMHHILAAWPPLGPLDSLELLDARYADARVRSYAVSRLDVLTDAQLQDYLLQLVQVLKYEPYHDNALCRFLVRRALRNARIGHVLFWFLKGEMHVSEISERYGLVLEAYLRGVPNFRKELSKQTNMLSVLEETARDLKGQEPSKMLDFLQSSLKKLEFPEPLQLPLSPMFEVKELLISKCKFMDSKKKPLWLNFVNPDPMGGNILVIFKEGDDLRQDMLTLQMLRIMDRLWRNHGLDMQMSPYGCISTGNEVGFIEVVLNASTTAHITRDAGGAKAAFKVEPINDWLRAQNPLEQSYEKARRHFLHSCAGYCVATYVLGIGDRHNDNIMLTKSGRLFHIDFGHFLGNFKTKFGIKRERAPFVFTPDFAFVLGGKGSPLYKEFVKLCCDAYNVLRKYSNLFINLFSMMLSTGIPELMKLSDIYYLRDAFSAELDEAQAAAKFEALIEESLNSLTTQLNNYTHILAH